MQTLIGCFFYDPFFHNQQSSYELTSIFKVVISIMKIKGRILKEVLFVCLFVFLNQKQTKGQERAESPRHRCV